MAEFIINHPYPEIEKEFRYILGYGGGMTQLIDHQLKLLNDWAERGEMPRLNLLVLPGCEICGLDIDPFTYQKGVRQADFVALDQISCWYIVKNRDTGITGEVSKDYFKRVVVPAGREFLERRQRTWTEEQLHPCRICSYPTGGGHYRCP